MQRYLMTVFACVLLSMRVALTWAADPPMIVVSTPDMPWELQFPRAHWTLQQTQQRDGGAYYYLFTNSSTHLTLSFFIEPATTCNSSVDCRRLFWSNPGPMYTNPRAVEQLEINGFAVVKFVIPKVGGFPVDQLNYSAHLVRDGYWVDMHVSQLLTQGTNEDAIPTLLKSISLHPKGH